MQGKGLFHGEATTGLMDDETITSIKSFQRSKRMVIDGRVSLELFLNVKSYRGEERILDSNVDNSVFSTTEKWSEQEWLEG